LVSPLIAKTKILRLEFPALVNAREPSLAQDDSVSLSCGTRACRERSRRALGCGFHL